MSENALQQAMFEHQMNALLADDVAWAGPIETWVGLFTAPETEVSTSGTAYSRVKVERDSSGWDTSFKNSDELLFPRPTANWGEIVGLGIFSAETGGDLLFYSTLTTAVNITSSTGIPNIPAESLVFRLGEPPPVEPPPPPPPTSIILRWGTPVVQFDDIPGFPVEGFNRIDVNRKDCLYYTYSTGIVPNGPDVNTMGHYPATSDNPLLVISRNAVRVHVCAQAFFIGYEASDLIFQKPISWEFDQIPTRDIGQLGQNVTNVHIQALGHCLFVQVGVPSEVELDDFGRPRPGDFVIEAYYKNTEDVRVIIGTLTLRITE